MNHLVLYFVYLAIGEFVTTYIATVGEWLPFVPGLCASAVPMIHTDDGGPP